MMKIIETDNFGRDYPNEQVAASDITWKMEAEVMADVLNQAEGPNAQRYYKVVDDNYVLQPGFEP